MIVQKKEQFSGLLALFQNSNTWVLFPVVINFFLKLSLYYQRLIFIFVTKSLLPRELFDYLVQQTIASHLIRNEYLYFYPKWLLPRELFDYLVQWTNIPNLIKNGDHLVRKGIVHVNIKCLLSKCPFHFYYAY